MVEIIGEVILLCLMMAFRIDFQKRARRLDGLQWEKFGFFSILVMVVVLAVSVVTWDGTTAENYARFIVVAGLVILCVMFPDKGSRYAVESSITNISQ